MIDNGFGSITKNAIRFLLNYFARFAISGVVVYICWIPIRNYNYWFTWHVILCTLGYLPLMAEGLLLFGKDELWSHQLSKTGKRYLHAALLTFSTALITAGTIVVIYYTNPGYHFYQDPGTAIGSAHGITGIISNILILVSLFLGVMAQYSQKLNGYIRPALNKFIHNLVGLSGYLIGILSIICAYYTAWFEYFTSEDSRAVATTATVLATLWTINTSVGSLRNQAQSVFSSFR